MNYALTLLLHFKNQHKIILININISLQPTIKNLLDACNILILSIKEVCVTVSIRYQKYTLTKFNHFNDNLQFRIQHFQSSVMTYN